MVGRVGGIQCLKKISPPGHLGGKGSGGWHGTGIGGTERSVTFAVNQLITVCLHHQHHSLGNPITSSHFPQTQNWNLISQTSHHPTHDAIAFVVTENETI